MNEEAFNISLRKFLKHFGVSGQRAIEQAVQDAMRAGVLKGDETLNARVTLAIDGIDLNTVIEGEITLA